MFSHKPYQANVQGSGSHLDEGDHVQRPSPWDDLEGEHTLDDERPAAEFVVLLTARETVEGIRQAGGILQRAEVYGHGLHVTPSSRAMAPRAPSASGTHGGGVAKGGPPLADVRYQHGAKMQRRKRQESLRLRLRTSSLAKFRLRPPTFRHGDASRAAYRRRMVMVPGLRQSGRIERPGTAEHSQDLPVQAQADSRTRAGP